MEEWSVGSRSLCLVDASLLLDFLGAEALDALCRERRLGTGELSRDGVLAVRNGRRGAPGVDLESLVAAGAFEVLGATAEEMASAVRWIGSRALCMAELELVSLVLAGKGTLCTRDVVVARAIRELGLDDRLEPAEGFMARPSLPANGGR